MRLTGYQATEGGIPYVVVKDEQEALQKLAAYEDTGYSPLEIKSLEGEWNAMRKVVDSYRKAEEEGRLIDADALKAHGDCLSRLHVDFDAPAGHQVWRECVPFDDIPTIIPAEPPKEE